jgi:hypothetical protein
MALSSRVATSALVEMEKAGLRNSEVYHELQADLAKTQHAILETRKEVKALGSEHRAFDQFAQSVSFLSSVYQVGAGSAALFGDKNENVTKSIQRLVAILSVANGAREIANQLTERGTIANRAYAAVQKQIGILTDVTTSATQKFSAGLKLSGIGFVISGLTFLIEKLGIFGAGEKSAAEKAQELNDSLSRQNEIFKGMVEVIAKANTETELFINRQIELADKSGKSSVGTFALRKKQAEEEKKIADQQLIDFARIHSDAESASKIITVDQASAKLKTLKDFISQDYLGALTEANSANNAFTNSQKDADKQQADFATTKANNLKSQLDLMDEVIAGSFNAQTKIDALVTANREQVSELIRKANTERKSAEQDFFKFRQELLINEQEVVAKGNFGTPGINIKAAENSAQLQKELIQKQQEFEIDAINKSEEDLKRKGDFTKAQALADAQKIENINKKATDDLLQIDEDLFTRKIQIRAQFRIAQKEELDQEVKDFQDAQTTKFEKESKGQEKGFKETQTKLSQIRADELKAQQDNLNNGTITLDVYNKRKEEIEFNYEQRVLQSQIIFYKQQLTLLKSFGLDTTEMEKAIADAEALIEDQKIEKKQRTKAELKDIDDQKLNNTIDGLQQIADAEDSVFSGIFDAQKNRVQEQMDLVDQWKEKEIDRINSTGESEEKKAAKIKIIEARAQSDKEKLEKRQREIDRQKAISEKSFKVFQIVTDNIQAINKIKLLIAATVDPITKALLGTQLFLAIATGAASLVSLIATPIPKFGKGTDNAPEGPAIVGEVGREIGLDSRGRLSLYSKPTLTYLTKGTKIFPNKITEDLINAAEHERGQQIQMITAASSSVDNTQLLEAAVAELREINKKNTQVYIHNENGIESSAWFHKQIRY